MSGDRYGICQVCGAGITTYSQAVIDPEVDLDRIRRNKPLPSRPICAEPADMLNRGRSCSRAKVRHTQFRSATDEED